ncbi:MAG TPA: cupredoxin domain-containing protein [Gemmatimonadaceae bacterium]|nr:cupredoxin domain-containing protein [Gemmatimonadaceae bacterium]
MKKIMFWMVALTALVAASPVAAATVNVSITRAGFVPNNVTVKQGDTVTWTNSDTQQHQVTSQNAPFASPVLAQNQTFSFAFSKAGRFAVTDPLNKNRKMNVTVEAAPATLSLTANKRLVGYGGAVTLSGVLSTQEANQQVMIEAQQCGAAGFTKVGTAVTGTGGAWNFAVKPLKNTAYQVKVKNVTSPQLTVRVRSAMSLGKVGLRRFTIRVRAADSFAGKAVAVQRYNSVTRRWVVLRSATLRADTTGVAPTVVSSVTFSRTIGRGTRLRVVMGQATAGSCYAAGTSNAIRI